MNVICFGDSNTYGYDPRGYFGGRYDADSRWVDILAMETGWTISNMGQNGREIPSAALAFPADTDLLIVMLGTNDLLQGRSPEQAAERLDRFLSGVSLDRSRVLLIAPPPVTLGAWVLSQQLIDGSRTFAQLCLALAERMGVRFADAGKWDIPLAYHSSLELALSNHCETVAFPLISSGVYGYPKDQALKVAVDTIGDFLLAHDMTVYLVIFDRTAYTISGKLFADIAAYIDDRYVDAHTDSRETQRRRMAMASMPMEEAECSPAPCTAAPSGLDDALSKLDESFSEMLLRKIDECGMTDAQCYKKANIDRKLFSKIRSDIHYKPSKPTAMAFAVALELPLEEAREMLGKAGFAFSHASKFDIIVEYFIAHRNYNIFEINEALFAFDQSLLGG